MAYHLTRQLARRGHDVTIVTSSADDRSGTDDYDGLKIHRYASRFQIGDTHISPSLLWKPPGDLGEVDIVHVHHTTPPGGAAGLMCAKRLKKPLVVTHHGFERFDDYGSILRRITVFFSAHLFVDMLLSQATAIIALSPYFIKLSRFLHKYLDKTVVIPNGVDLEEYALAISARDCRAQLGLPVGVPLVLYVGSFRPRKGVRVLLKAFKRVVTDLPEAQLILLGQGPKEGALKQLASELGLSSHVHFVGFIADNRTKAMYYRAADALVIPSTTSEMESFNLVILEGSASGCAMVVSDLETFKYIILEGTNAVVTRAGDASSLGDGILRVLRNPDLRMSLSAEAVRRVRPFSWSSVAEQTEDLYERILRS